MHPVDYKSSSRVVFAVLLGLLLLAGGAAAQAPAPDAKPEAKPAGPPDITGLWIDHTGQGAVEIAPCGDRVCGKVVWLKNPKHKSKSGKLICGSQILGDLRKQARNLWESGWIYDPEDEERFNASLELAGANTLRVTGYLGIKMLGETYIWKRATAILERCAGGAT
jgi:uncharacterized protein (DUF2147 family)